MHIYTRALRERKPLPMPKFEMKIIPNLNPDFWIDIDVHWICPKMLWMHYLVGVSHFAKYGTNRTLIVVRNANKCPKIPYSAVVKKK